MDYFLHCNNPSFFDSSSSSSSMAINNTDGKDKKKSSNKATVKLSTDPQSVAARERRHRISERFKTLQSLIPGGAKMDTVSMLEEAIQYVKFLKAQIWLHQTMINFACDDHHGHDFLVPSPSDYHQQQQSHFLLSSEENYYYLMGQMQAMLPQLGLPEYSCFQLEGDQDTIPSDVMFPSATTI